MATLNDSWVVKSLKNSKGGYRFKFEKSSQRISVYRSLDKVMDKPSKESSFFKDCLVEMRELNTSADFILFYEEMLMSVQSPQLVNLQKELLFSKLVSGLQMKARLSLEPILRLIVALSRDLLEEFIAYYPKDDINDRMSESMSYNDEQVVFFKAFELLDSGKGKSTFLALTSGKT